MSSMVGTHAGGEAPCAGMEDALREHEKLGLSLLPDLPDYLQERMFWKIQFMVIIGML